MYNYYVETLENPEHPEYTGYDELLDSDGGDSDPRVFDLDEVNAALRALR